MSIQTDYTIDLENTVNLAREFTEDLDKDCRASAIAAIIIRDGLIRVEFALKNLSEQNFSVGVWSPDMSSIRVEKID